MTPPSEALDTEIPADDRPVLEEVHGRALVLTLNRPKVLNAQNQPLRDALVDALDRFEADGELDVVVICGAGRAFSAGADLRERQVLAADDAPSPGRPASMRHFDRLDELTKPSIAVLHGYAVGGGLELALCCDVRVAAEDALLGTPEARTIAGIPGVAVHRLLSMIPAGDAMRMMLSSQPVPAGRALDIGLVQEVAADREAALAGALHLAAQMSGCDQAALAKIKRTARWTLRAAIEASRLANDSSS